MQERNNDLNTFISSCVVFFCIIGSQLIVAAVAVGFMITFHCLCHVRAGFICQRFQIIKFRGKIQFRKILKRGIQLIQISQQFISCCIRFRIYVIDGSIDIGDFCAAKQKGYRSGIDDYLVKPIDLDELLLHIGALLRRAKIANSHKIEIGSLKLDADEHTAYLNDEEIPLTVREFNLIYKLLSYPKKTFTRAQLMDEFWDGDTSSGLRTVDVYMTKLRNKFADCDAFEIVTVHGLGYKAVVK